MDVLVSPLLSSTVLMGVFALMWWKYREHWLGYWAVAFALFLVRYAYGLLADAESFGEYYVVLPALAIARGYFLLAGAFALAQRPMPTAVQALFIADGLVLAWEAVAAPVATFGQAGATHYLLFGLATVASAGMLLARRRELGRESYLVVYALVCIGLVNASFPWVSRMADQSVATAYFLVADAAQSLVGIGAMLVFHRRATNERDAALQRMEAALAKALKGYVPICAYCKSVRDRDRDGGWESLERFVSEHTDASLTHGICPKCEAQYFGMDLGSAGTDAAT
ncbi:MAG: hypothetical protein KF709_14510 [Gemmatimonadaceae bacterium]|nr:hypothetical protein [Gemmatimonadaceae bacterium]